HRPRHGHSRRRDVRETRACHPALSLPKRIRSPTLRARRMPERVPPSPSSADTAQGLVMAAHAAASFAKRWKALRKGKSITLDHIAREAFAFSAALAVQALPDRRVWLICADARTQERVHGELHVWGVHALFFPRLGQAETPGI